MERSRISSWSLRHFPEWCWWWWSDSVTMTAGWSRSCFARLSPLMTSTLMCPLPSHALLQYFLPPLSCLFLAHSPRPGLKRRGKISLVYSQEEKKLVKQIIWIFIAPRFYGSHFACNFSTHYSILHGTHFLSFCFSRRQGHTLSGTAKGTRWSVGDYWWSANRPHIFVAFLLQSKTKIYSKNKI